MIGEETETSKTSLKIHGGVQKWWKKWMTQDLPEQDQKDLLQKYARNGAYYTEAPKINPEVDRHLTEIGKKRDKHFADTQNYTGSALQALATAISMGIEDEEIDFQKLMVHLWDAGKLISSIFHQQSVARKSFITPALDKEIKATLEATIPDEFLYGKTLTEQVKEAKTIEKASASLKAPIVKKTFHKNTNQGNWKGPPQFHQYPKNNQAGGYHQKRTFKNTGYKFKTNSNNQALKTFSTAKKSSTQISNKK